MNELRLTGLVLAGGRSTRMGSDKALLHLDGKRLVDRAVATLRRVCGDVLIAAGERRIDGVDARPVPDADGEGPLAGIVAGLDHASTRLVAVLAVDMPFADASVFSLLATRWEGQVAVAPRVDGRVQPLHAVYATDAAEALRRVLAAGERSPARALATLGAVVVDEQALREAGVNPLFARNVNSPADLRAASGPATPGSR